VIIHDLDVVRVPLVPAKADAVLIVDPNAVLADPIPLQRFQPIARQRGKVTQDRRDVQRVQTSTRNGFDIGEPGHSFSSKEPFGIGAAKRLNHSVHYSVSFTESVKLYG
jgi:hypothetical protein